MSNQTDERSPGTAPPVEWVADGALQWPSDDARSDVVKRREDLYDAMRRLEAALARPSGLADWRIEIELALSGLESALNDHVEEIDPGLFAEIMDRAPQLAPAVDSLRQEHEELQTACHTALSMAADWAATTLRRRTNMLLARLAIHRQNGAEILFDAYNVELAAGD